MDEHRPDEFAEQIGDKAERKREARGHSDGPWFWLGMTGIVGWSVIVPTMLGLLAGQWLDNRWPQGFSWSLSLLMVGLALGCLNAWHWVRRSTRDD